MKDAIITFVEKINHLDDIESMERDDVYTALCTIMKNCPIEVEDEMWEKWFDETRDF